VLGKVRIKESQTQEKEHEARKEQEGRETTIVMSDRLSGERLKMGGRIEVKSR